MNNNERLTKMLYLGISEEHDAGVSILQGGEILFAANEERFSRKKFQLGFPKRSLEEALSFLKDRDIKPDFQTIGLASKIHIENSELALRNDAIYNFTHLAMSGLNRLGFGRYFLGAKWGVSIGGALYRKLQPGRIKRIKKGLAEYNLDHIPVSLFDHHFAHATSTYYTSGLKNCLSITLDASGDGYCSRVYICNNGKMELVHSIPFYHSIGYYYTLVTYILGFKTGQEGKVTGLSARGNPDKALSIFQELIPYDQQKMRFDNRRKSGFFDQKELKLKLSGFDREDVAAAVQKHLEDSVVNYIEDLIKRFSQKQKITDLALSGGIFANVLLNQKIAEIDQVGKVFIHPHMGDGGLATGAAFAAILENKEKILPYELGNVFLAGELKDQEIVQELLKSGLKFEKRRSIEKDIGKLLSEGKVVVRVVGRMEYGPRALGNRSILYKTDDPTINSWLNKKLNRSEFMPFAPIVLEQKVEEYFQLNGHELPARFMTITCRTTKKCQQECPAIVHVDGTARPQVVGKSVNKDLYNILIEYESITGIPVLINTSFNMHEEPIVHNASTAIQAFIKGKLDYMALGDYLITGI